MVIAAGLVSCAMTRHGTLVRRRDDLVIRVTVVLHGDGATVTGVNTVTGEQLLGRLSPAPERSWENPDDRIGPPPIGSGSSAVPGGSPPPLPAAGVLHLVGDLQGDQGTTLRCSAQVRQTLRLHGEGVCFPLTGDKHSTYILEF